MITVLMSIIYSWGMTGHYARRTAAPTYELLHHRQTDKGISSCRTRSSISIGAGITNKPRHPLRRGARRRCCRAGSLAADVGRGQSSSFELPYARPHHTSSCAGLSRSVFDEFAAKKDFSGHRSVSVPLIHMEYKRK